MTRRTRSIPALTAALMLAACSVDANDPIVGRWRLRDNDCVGGLGRIHFAPNGRMTTFVRVREPGLPAGVQVFASPRAAGTFDIMRPVDGCPSLIEIPAGFSKYSTLHVFSRSIVFARLPGKRSAFYRRNGDTLLFGYAADLSDAHTYVTDTSGVENPLEMFDRFPKPPRF